MPTAERRGMDGRRRYTLKLWHLAATVGLVAAACWIATSLDVPRNLPAFAIIAVYFTASLPLAAFFSWKLTIPAIRAIYGYQRRRFPPKGVWSAILWLLMVPVVIYAGCFVIEIVILSAFTATLPILLLLSLVGPLR